MGKTVFQYALLAVALAAAPLAAAPQIDAAKETDIRRLMELTGASKTGEAVMTAMMQQMKPMLEKTIPESPHKSEMIDTFLERFPKRIRTQDLVEIAVPIYDKHLTHEDIKGLIEFYQTPLGQRVIHEMPQIAVESQAAGGELGRKIAQDVMTEVVDEIQAREKNP